MKTQRAIVLVGSAKPAGRSTSEPLARYLCARLEARGVAATVTVVGRSPRSQAERTLAAVLREADLFVIATSLYVDSLPYLVTRALEHLVCSPRSTPCALAAIINCGFPQPEQAATALDILRAFARRAGFTWAGGLAMGEGGAIDGRAIDARGGLTRHIAVALDRAAADLSEGRPISTPAVEQFARHLMPARVYTFMGNLGWRLKAAHHHVASSLDARPFDVNPP